jgi:hypothetical protein
MISIARTFPLWIDVAGPGDATRGLVPFFKAKVNSSRRFPCQIDFNQLSFDVDRSLPDEHHSSAMASVCLASEFGYLSHILEAFEPNCTRG